MNRLTAYSLLLTAFLTSGCVMRTSTYEVDRVDQEITGNRGIIMGEVPEAEETEAKKRTMYNLEVELPSFYRTEKERQREHSLDKDLYGNRGYIQGSRAPEKEVCIPKGSKDASTLGNLRLRGMPQVVYSEPVERQSVGEGEAAGANVRETGFYIVQKGETLQKISQNIYGTTKNWKKIYEANKNTLKNPDRIRPGQKLAIPKE